MDVSFPVGNALCTMYEGSSTSLYKGCTCEIYNINNNKMTLHCEIASSSSMNNAPSCRVTYELANSLYDCKSNS